MSPLLLLAPLLLAFEVWQLVLGERYVGIKQIERDTDPRTLGLGEFTAFFWSSGILLGWAWTIAMLVQGEFRAQAGCMLFVSMVGYALRRGSGLKWILVIMTLEGAVRVGMLVSVIGAAWHRM